MTISTTANKVVYTGNGATTTWPFAFRIPALANVIVTVVTISSGDENVISPSLYSATGLNDDAGGSITYPLSGSPLSSLYQIVIERSIPYTQGTDLDNQSGAYPEDIEEALDLLTMQTQQLDNRMDRALVTSVADTIGGTIPSTVARALKVLGFDASGAPIAVDGITAGTTVSSAMIPVVTAASTATALTALGIPGTLLDLLIPAGTEWPYHAGGTAPTGFAYAYNQACTSLWPVYRARLISDGSPYGNNGTDPLLPDLRNVVSAGKGNMGGVDRGLLTGGTVLGALLGTQSRTLLLANLPPYTPAGGITNGAITITPSDLTVIGMKNGIGNITYAGGAATGQQNLPTYTATQAASSFAGTAQGGTSTAFGIVQPTIVCNKILKVH